MKRERKHSVSSFEGLVANLKKQGFRELTVDELFTVNGGKRKSSSSSSSSSGNSGTKNTSSSAASAAVTAATSGASTGESIGSNTGSDKGKANSNQNNDSKSTKNNTNSNTNDSTKHESGWNQFIHGFLGIGNNDDNRQSGEKTTSSSDSSKNESVDSYQEGYNTTVSDCKQNTEIEKTKSSDTITNNQQITKKTDIKFNQISKIEENIFDSFNQTLLKESKNSKDGFSICLPDKSVTYSKKNFSSSLSFDITSDTSWRTGNNFNLSFKKEPNSIITTILKTPVSIHSLTLNKITLEFQIKL